MDAVVKNVVAVLKATVANPEEHLEKEEVGVDAVVINVVAVLKAAVAAAVVVVVN